MLSTTVQLQSYLTEIRATQWATEVAMQDICPKASGSIKCPEVDQVSSVQFKCGSTKCADVCPEVIDKTRCPDGQFKSPSKLDQFVLAFGESAILLDGLGVVKSQQLPGRTYQERVFGDFTCTGCLDGIPGGNDPADERCNATFAEGETLFSVAPKYQMDWMLMWSLNGGDAPDTVSKPGAPYRFAHQVCIPGGTPRSTFPPWCTKNCPGIIFRKQNDLGARQRSAYT